MDSMEQIYLSHARTVYAFLLTKTQNPDLAEELTQETFYQAVKSIHRFKEQSSVSTWLCGIARNVWFDHCGSRRAGLILKKRRKSQSPPLRRRYSAPGIISRS